MREVRYRGRFAPTPSGPLHFGSLVAALGSYLEARVHGGEWLIRIEDIDPPRVVPGAADRILHSLECLGFEWDGPVMSQNCRGEAYHAALAYLWISGRLYPCGCSRKSITERSPLGVDGPVYQGTCLHHPPKGGPLSIRFRVDEERLVFHDAQQGIVGCDLPTECGDFVVCRADGVFTYQLAVVVDDAAQGITHVVRGADLLMSTPRQITLQRALGLPSPEYLHLSVALDERGEKLSKQTHADAIDERNPVPLLVAALSFLGGALPEQPGNLNEFWTLASTAWAERRILPIRGRRPNLCNP